MEIVKRQQKAWQQSNHVSASLRTLKDLKYIFYGLKILKLWVDAPIYTARTKGIQVKDLQQA